MLLHNKPYQDLNLTDDRPRITFHKLEPGDKYIAFPGGKVRTVFRKELGLIIIRREDDWLITCLEGGYIWNKEVIKIN